jgi:Predicted peptidase
MTNLSHARSAARQSRRGSARTFTAAVSAAALLSGLLLLHTPAGASETAAAAPVVTAAVPQQASARPTEKGFLLRTITLDDTEHRYIAFVPPSYDPAKKWPVIVFLNGAGECGTDGFKQAAVGLGSAVMQNAEKWPYVILFPQKPTRQTRWLDHDALVLGVLDKALSEWSLDPNRVYLTGLSQGGFGTWDIGSKHPERFAALAPICGGASNPAALAALKDMPIRVFHGEADPTVPVERSKAAVEGVKAAGGGANVTLTTYPGVGHNSWDKAYRDEGLWEWFLTHEKKAKP